MATVGECMSIDIPPVGPDTTLIEAAQQMRISGVGGIPVRDRGGEECAGILTERDIVVRVLAEEREPLPVCQAGHVVGVVSLADIVFVRRDAERGTIVPPRVMSR